MEKAKLYYDMGLFGDAKFPIEVYTQKIPDDPEGWLLFGMIEIKCKRYGHALDYLDKANALYGGENYRCFAAKANVYLRKGEYDLAEKEILNAIRTDPSKGLPYYYLGLLDLRDHDTLSAVSYFETAIGLDIYNAPVVELASKGLLRVGRIDLAMEIYEEELEKDSTNYDTWTNLGYIQYLSEQYKESFDSYQHALSINDEYISQLLYNQGAILWTMGNRKEGKEYILRSSEYGNYNAKMFLAQPASAGFVTGIVALGILQAFNVY
jgi:tetratricopeptide (TPR) repeat protein